MREPCLSSELFLPPHFVEADRVLEAFEQQAVALRQDADGLTFVFSQPPPNVPAQAVAVYQNEAT